MNFYKIVVAVALIALVSCVGEEAPSDVPSGGQSSIEKFTGRIPSVGEVDLLWENKDAIALRSQENPEELPVSSVYAATLPAPKATAVFKKSAAGQGAPDKLGGKYIAVYPAALNYSEWAKDSYVLVAPNSQQTVLNKKIDKSSMVMVASSDDTELNFKHVVSYVKFTVTSSTSPFNKVTVTSGDPSQYMVSRIRVSFDENFTQRLETYDASGNMNPQTKDKVSFTTSDGSNFAAGTYLIAVNPDSYAKGIVLTFENSYKSSVTKKCPGPYQVKPGETIDAGEIGYLDFQITSSYINLYEKDNQKIGVVFYVDPADSKKKKVVSAASDFVQWAKKNETWRISGSKEDYDYVHTIVTSTDMYIDNPADFPAVMFCDQMRKAYGGNWHVPSVGELNMLFNAYYGKSSDEPVSKDLVYTDSKSQQAAQYFDSLLKLMGGEKMLNQAGEYWSCAQNSNGVVNYVNMNRYYQGIDNQTTQRNVRCVRDVDVNISDDDIVYPQTNVGRLLKGNITKRIEDVLWDTTYNVTKGLDYYQMQVLTDAKEKLDVYMLRCDPSKGLDVRVAISTKTTADTWDLQNLSEMAAGISTSSRPVYAIINADFTDRRTSIRPRGPVHCNGKVWCSTYSLDPEYEHQGLSYVGMTYDGKMTMGLREEYASAKSSLKECTGGGYLMVEDSKIVGYGSDSRDPRTAIGYTKNNVIWMLAVDGRHKGTEGMTYSELSSIFYDIGCVDAVNLDGGGSTQMLTRDPKTGRLIMRNWPSDPTDGEGGEPRPRLSGWAIVKK